MNAFRCSLRSLLPAIPSVAKPARFMSTPGSSAAKTAAICIIGDEILSGKTIDTNTNTLAKLLFNMGIELKRVEVIPDEENDIVKSVRQLSDGYDFVFTSGGIGPTHDDITYESIAKAFDTQLEYHQPTLERMVKIIGKGEPGATVEGISKARKRMALLPKSAETVFPLEELWVPIAIVNKNVHILPGVPSIFNKLIRGFAPELMKRAGGDDVPSRAFHRIQIVTDSKESDIADVLTEAQNRAGSKVKIGSYPKMEDGVKNRVFVSFVSTDAAAARRLAKDVESRIGGYGWTESSPESSS